MIQIPNFLLMFQSLLSKTFVKIIDGLNIVVLEKTLESLESEVAQLCLTLCDPMDCSLPGSSVHGIFQARVLEWAAISFSRGSSQPRIEPRFPALQADTLLSEPPLAEHSGSGEDS